MDRPIIVCLCGSTRFSQAFHEANLRETLAGKIVLSIGVDTKSDADLLLAGEFTQEDKERLDHLHHRKIELADEVLFLNVGGYMGKSTLIEHFYASHLGKTIRYLEQPMDNNHYVKAHELGVAWVRRMREQNILYDIEPVNRGEWFLDDLPVYLGVDSVGIAPAINVLASTTREDGVREITQCTLDSISLVPLEQSLNPLWRVTEIDGKSVE